ncbi:MAG TPA: glycosyltransferase [Tepidisphaeraceae bacterium]|jgi:spore maturation protein CgeB|nr:glycosyltransferase [Tepidisphaeraceae bacterium]
MRIRLFYHSLLSDWNHGNAHFLRGIVGELMARGHDVRVYEPHDGWSYQSLRQEYGERPFAEFRAVYPGQESVRYKLDEFDLDEALDGADLVIVHEWNKHELVRRIGQHRNRRRDYRLLFHDTHHRAVTDPAAMEAYDLSHYDGVLAYGNVLRDLYLQRGWTGRAWTWHEAADTRVFRPAEVTAETGDLIWIGNWGDEERTAELHEYLLDPVKALGLRARLHGVRYPDHARRALADSGIEYAGWLANFKAPAAFAGFKVTVHVPRRPYVEALPGIPTIRVFEALACGIPLVCSPWKDVEGLFAPGSDYLLARDGAEMTAHLRMIFQDSAAAAELSAHGLQTILSRHTCGHRVAELLSIDGALERGARHNAGAPPLSPPAKNPPGVGTPLSQATTVGAMEDRT